jgi:hypothetical protein
MTARDLPIRPDLDQLKHQAKDLLRDLRNGDPGAAAELKEFHLRSVDPRRAKLADAQLVIARSYGATSWPRLALACRVIDAIWSDDVAAIRKLISRDSQVLNESALLRSRNWGAPMSYAANMDAIGSFVPCTISARRIIDTRSAARCSRDRSVLPACCTRSRARQRFLTMHLAGPPIP